MRFKKKSVIGRLYIAALMLLYCGINGTLGNGQSNTALNVSSPVALVRAYCRMDLDGARLSSEGTDSEKISTLATWPVEPGWDTIVVVRAFEVVGENVGTKKSKVTVRYLLLGNMFGARITPSSKHDELVTFDLIKSDEGWKIERPMIAPHVSVKAATAALSSLIADEKDPEQIKRLDSGIETLAKWKRKGTGERDPRTDK